jgi:hypothetical protein
MALRREARAIRSPGLLIARSIIVVHSSDGPARWIRKPLCEPPGNSLGVVSHPFDSGLQVFDRLLKMARPVGGCDWIVDRYALGLTFIGHGKLKRGKPLSGPSIRSSFVTPRILRERFAAKTGAAQ